MFCRTFTRINIAHSRIQGIQPPFVPISIIIFFSFSINMESHQTKPNIQQMQQGQKDFGILNSVKNLHKKIVNNNLVSEFDVFSVPVKLLLNGQEVYPTFCGGLSHILLLGLCVIITIVILFPGGVQLSSELSVSVVPTISGNTGQTLFDHTDEILAWRGLRKSGTTYSGNGNISSYATFRAYQVKSGNVSTPLVVSNSGCSGDAEFCLKKSEQNKDATIYGNYYNPTIESKYIVLELVWCNTSIPLTCPLSSLYALEVNFTNFYKKKGGEVVGYPIRLITQILNAAYFTNITKEVYTSNSKFFGHIANLFPNSVQTYLFNEYITRSTIAASALITPAVPVTFKYLQLNIVPNGLTRQINENFDDISNVILFFLSIKETFYLVIFFIFIKHYNRNSGLLDVASSLFYMDDPKTKKKYDFNSGYQVFFACLLYNHPICNLLHFILTKFGKTIEDMFSNKAVCAMKLMSKAEELLQQNVFYGNLNELSSMQSEASRKIQLVEKEEQEKQDEETEISYFPFLPTDTEPMRKQKEVKKQAFQQFCQANEYISADRKNHAYKVITNNKMKHLLTHEMQKEFKEFLRNVRIQMNEDLYQELPDQEFSEIKVAIHESSKQQMMTGENFIRT